MMTPVATSNTRLQQANSSSSSSSTIASPISAFSQSHTRTQHADGTTGTSPLLGQHAHVTATARTYVPPPSHQVLMPRTQSQPIAIQRPQSARNSHRPYVANDTSDEDEEDHDDTEISHSIDNHHEVERYYKTGYDEVDGYNLDEDDELTSHQRRAARIEPVDDDEEDDMEQDPVVADAIRLGVATPALAVLATSQTVSAGLRESSTTVRSQRRNHVHHSFRTQYPKAASRSLPNRLLRAPYLGAIQPSFDQWDAVDGDPDLAPFDIHPSGTTKSPGRQKDATATYSPSGGVETNAPPHMLPPPISQLRDQHLLRSSMNETIIRPGSTTESSFTITCPHVTTLSTHSVAYGSLRDSHDQGRFLDGPSSYRDRRTGYIHSLHQRVRFQDAQRSDNIETVENNDVQYRTDPAWAGMASSLPAHTSGTSIAERISHRLHQEKQSSYKTDIRSSGEMAMGKTDATLLLPEDTTMSSPGRSDRRTSSSLTLMLQQTTPTIANKDPCSPASFQHANVMEPLDLPSTNLSAIEYPHDHESAFGKTPTFYDHELQATNITSDFMSTSLTGLEILQNQRYRKQNVMQSTDAWTAGSAATASGFHSNAAGAVLGASFLSPLTERVGLASSDSVILGVAGTSPPSILPSFQALARTLSDPVRAPLKPTTRITNSKKSLVPHEFSNDSVQASAPAISVPEIVIADAPLPNVLNSSAGSHCNYTQRPGYVPTENPDAEGAFDMDLDLE